MEDSHLQVILLNAYCQIKDFFSQCNQACHTIFMSQCLPETATTFTGTIICPVNGEQLRLCIQEDSSSSSPLILLDIPLSTSSFSSLIRYGTIRMVLECMSESKEELPLLSMPKWVMYCNGQKMGFAKRREVDRNDAWLLEMLRSVSAGAGVLPDKDSGGYKYLRGQFEQVATGSDNSEAYHLIDPSSCFGQDLSVFFLRSTAM
ncbi:hypothetical protein LWI28_027286 [Acer negundo]|uniref:Protein MIZU-KUSSEI 1-like n=1 Tax=Acer negundo TaxID=4023 RepID=A0AAD5IQ08_ACENE|nr:hypothetical protein LWI28_027286 [Acer negundo]